MPSNSLPPGSQPTVEGEDSVRAHFRAQGNSCRAMGSPFTAALLETAAECLTKDHPVGMAVLDWCGTPSDDALGLRFCAGLHWLALCGIDEELADFYRSRTIVGEVPASWRLIERALIRHAAALMRFIERPPQTNEVGRSGVLFGGFMAIARRTGLPLSLREVGASAGLNLNWHRYGYRPSGIDLEWGAIDGPVVLRPSWEGPAPRLADVKVGDVMGCDLNPADLSAITLSSDPNGPASDEANRLLSYIWPDQEARMERMRGALRIAGEHPPLVEQDGAAEWLGKVVPQQKQGCTQVVFHTVVWQYVSEEQRQGVKLVMDRAAEAATTDKPLAWLRMEPSESGGCAELRVSIWPDRQDIHLADVCYHGKWIRWLGND